MEIAVKYNGHASNPNYEIDDIEHSSLEFAGEHLKAVIANHLEQTFDPNILMDEFSIVIVLHGLKEGGYPIYTIGVESDNKELESKLLQELDKLTGGSSDNDILGGEDWFE